MSSRADARCAEWTRWALRPDCGVEDLPDGTVQVACDDTRARLRDLSPAGRRLVSRMALGPVALANVGFDSAPAAVIGSLGPAAVRSLVSSDDGTEILSIESFGPGPPPLSVSVPASNRTLRWVGGGDLHEVRPADPDRLALSVRRPSAPEGGTEHRLVVRGQALRAARPFRRGATVVQAARSTGLDLDVVGATAGHLLAVGALCAVS